MALRAPETAAISFAGGQGGLETARLEADFSAELPAGAGAVELRNDAYPGTQGWKAVQILPGNRTDVTSDVPATDPTDGLTSYPGGPAREPARPASGVVHGHARKRRDQRSRRGPRAAMTATRPTARRTGSPVCLTGADTGGILILFLLGAAFGWGALHALSPGHGKSMVAGYLAGTDSRPRHAVILGMTVTVDAHLHRVRLRPGDPGGVAVHRARADLPLAGRGLGADGPGDRAARSWRSGFGAGARCALRSPSMQGDGHHAATQHSHDSTPTTTDHSHDHDTPTSRTDHGHSHHLEPGEPVTLKGLIGLRGLRRAGALPLGDGRADRGRSPSTAWAWGWR